MRLYRQIQDAILALTGADATWRAGGWFADYEYDATHVGCALAELEHALDDAYPEGPP